MTRAVRVLRSLVLALAIAGCASSGHKFEWYQVDALKPGMTVAEIEKVLGKTSGIGYMPDGTTVRTWMWSRASALGRSEARSVGIHFDSRGKMIRLLQRAGSETR